MTKDELLEKATYIQYASGGKYKDYGINCIHKLPYEGKGDLYTGWRLNEHHFTTEYHRKYSIPLLCNLLGLKYHEDQFVLEERHSGEFDISILAPKKNYEYEVYGYTRKEHFDNLSFFDITSNNSPKSDITDYHRLYKYGHECSRLINKTIDSDRKLFINGDSQMIPDVSFLSCFFKEVWYFDNRERKTLKDKYAGVEFTDVIIEMGFGNYNDYIINNFM